VRGGKPDSLKNWEAMAAATEVQVDGKCRAQALVPYAAPRATGVPPGPDHAHVASHTLRRRTPRHAPTPRVHGMPSSHPALPVARFMRAAGGAPPGRDSLAGCVGMPASPVLALEGARRWPYEQRGSLHRGCRAVGAVCRRTCTVMRDS
jgi:hypothetical protein